MKNLGPAPKTGSEEITALVPGALMKRQSPNGGPSHPDAGAQRDLHSPRDASFDGRLDRKWTRWGTG